MARKIIYRENGLANQPSAPQGFRYVGYYGNEFSEKFGITISTIGGGGGINLYNTDDSLTGNRIVTGGSYSLTFTGTLKTISPGASASNTAFVVRNSGDTSNHFYVRGDGRVGINYDNPTSMLSIKGSNSVKSTLGMNFTNSSENSWWNVYNDGRVNQTMRVAFSSGTDINTAHVVNAVNDDLPIISGGTGAYLYGQFVSVTGINAFAGFYQNITNGTYVELGRPDMSGYFSKTGQGDVLLNLGDYAIQTNAYVSPTKAKAAIGGTNTAILTYGAGTTSGTYNLRLLNSGSTEIGYVLDSGDSYFKGNMGIGINAPSDKLEVSGNSKIIGTLKTISPSSSSLDTAFAVRNNTDTTNHFHITGDGQWAFGNVTVAFGYWGSFRANTDVDTNGIYLDNTGSAQGGTYMSNQSNFNNHYASINFKTIGYAANMELSPDGANGFFALVGRSGASGSISSIGFNAVVNNYVGFTGGTAVKGTGINPNSIGVHASATDGVTTDAGYAAKLEGRTLFKSYSKSALPSVTNQANHSGVIVVTDATGPSAYTICISNGTNWIDTNTGIAVV